ncbi:MAG: phage terminase large subunit, partial [Pseudomonadota bacterium]
MSTDANLLEVFEAALRNNLSAFLQKCFQTVDAGSRYQHNWHIDAIAHHLEQVERDEITRLIITMPPRSLKSISASVAFPAWLLGRNPKKSILAVSYSESLAEKFAVDCQKVMQSAWYQSCFPGTRISRGRSARNDYETSLGGGRYSTSISGSLTGRGGDIIVIDDPHKPEDAASDVKRRSVIDWYRSTLLSRLNDPKTDPIILIQQRVHEEDLAGFLLEQGGWAHLDLQAVADEQTVIEIGKGRKMIREEGDTLHPDRMPKDLLNQRRVELGSYVFAAQFQQRPAPLGGGMVRWEWFPLYDTPPTRGPGDQLVQSWDTASKAEEANDYSVCTTWLVRRKREAWLLDVFRHKLEFPELRKRLISHAAHWKPSLILIENAGSGTHLMQDLRQSTRYNIRGIIPRDDKATRLMSVTPMIEGGRIAIPKEAPWIADFRQELVMFPKGRHDDQVDSVSQFLNWLATPAATALFGTWS